MAERPDNKLLVTAAEAAEALGLSPRTLYAISHPRGPVPCVRLGPRIVRYSPAALEAFVQERQLAQTA